MGVNVGLFGSADRDVSFRLSSGSVSKVLTACSKRYCTKTGAGGNQSSGEFFDPCFARMDDMFDAKKDEMRICVEVLDSVTRHHVEAVGNCVFWKLDNCGALFDAMSSGESISSGHKYIRSGIVHPNA